MFLCPTSSFQNQVSAEGIRYLFHNLFFMLSCCIWSQPGFCMLKRIVCVQVLCDEETCGRESFEVDTQEGEVLSRGSSAFFKDVYFSEGLPIGATASFACTLMFV